MSHKKYRAETNCLNCGAEVTGKFCSKCGQENIETRENIFHLVGHFVSDYLHFDSKFFRSLIPLFTKPGFLTKKYWEGKRVHYIHPLRLFFFITIFFMISTTYFYNKFGHRVKGAIKPDKLLVKYDSTFIATHADTFKIYEKEWGDTAVTVKDLKDFHVRGKRQARKLGQAFDNFFANVKYVTFLLLPVYALIFKLLYIRRKTFYVDQLVYTMHLQSFAYCLLSLTLMIPFVFDTELQRVLQVTFLSLFIYVGISLYYLYRQPIWKTVIKAFVGTFLLFITTGVSLFTFALIDAMFIEK